MPIPTTSDLLSPDLYLIGDAGTYTDAGKTTAATAADDLVRAWADQSGHGHDFANPAGAAPVLSATGPGGRRGVQFTAASSNFLDGGNPAGLDLSATGYTIVAVGLPTQGYDHWLSKGAFGNPPAQRIEFMAQSDGVNGPFGRWVSAGGYRAQPLTLAAYTYAPGGVDTGTETTRLLTSTGGIPVVRTGEVPAYDAASDWRIGLSGSNNFPFSGPIYAILIWRRVLADAEMRAVAAVLCPYFAAPYRVGTGTDALIVLVGDSTANGGASGPWADPLTQTTALLGDKYPAYNGGVDGRSMDQLIGDAARVTAWYSADYGANVLFVNCLINTLKADAGGKTPAEAYAQYQSYGTARKADGYAVCLCTCTANLYSASGYPATTNALLRADFAVATSHPRVFAANPGVDYADYLVDFAADPRLANPADTTYFTDQTHFTSAGSGVHAEHYAAAARIAAGLSPALSVDEVADGGTDAAGSVAHNATRTYTLTNDGDADATGVTIDVPIGTTLVTAPTTVAAGESETFVVRFSTPEASVSGLVTVSADEVDDYAFTLTAQVGAGGPVVVLDWNSVAQVSGYDVYVDNTKVAGSSTNSFTYRLTQPSASIRVVAYQLRSGQRRQLATGTADLAARVAQTVVDPSGLTYTPNNFKGTLNWSAVAQASGYEIYANGEYAGGTSTTSFVVTPDEVLTLFRVVAYQIRSGVKRTLSSTSVGVALTAPNVTLILTPV